jgi:CheY-like chemotaxis protein
MVAIKANVQMLSDSKATNPVVLCVDDDDAILRMIKTALECDGYTVLTATNGPAGLDAFSLQAVNVVVLDYEMPGMNGGELAVAMKRLKPEVPKLLFTGCAEIPANAAKAVEGFCTKTDGVIALLSRVEAMMSISAIPVVLTA